MIILDFLMWQLNDKKAHSVLLFIKCWAYRPLPDVVNPLVLRFIRLKIQHEACILFSDASQPDISYVDLPLRATEAVKNVTRFPPLKGKNNKVLYE